MCGRYNMAAETDERAMREILRQIDARNDPWSAGMKRAGDVRPTDIAPVVARNRRGEIASFPMRWGYAGAAGRPVINARSETARGKTLFCESFEKRRCLVPCGAYYEWQKTKDGRVGYAFARDGILWMAGLYRSEADGHAAFVILTREAAPEFAAIHDRMPVIVPEEMKDAWLLGTVEPMRVIEQSATELRYDTVG